MNGSDPRCVAAGTTPLMASVAPVLTGRRIVVYGMNYAPEIAGVVASV